MDRTPVRGSVIGLTETGGIALSTAFLSAFALVMVAWIGNRQRINRNEANADRQVLFDRQGELQDAVKPANGHDTLGQALEEIANSQREMTVQLDRVDVRLAEGEQRFDRIEATLNDRGTRIERIEEKSAETLALVGDNHHLFKNYIEAWTPLAARAVGEWGADGTKEKRKDHGRRHDK
jgi:hypothetical protein